MATEYIKREDALGAFKRAYMIPGQGTAREIYAKQIENTYRHIESIPAADVVERKHGEWIKADDGFDESWVCSECMEEYVSVDADFIDYAHYCPNCGAQMVSADDVLRTD